MVKRGVGEIISQISSGQMKQLKLVLKADTKGSLEALKQSLAQIKHEDVGVKIVLSGVGGITESDVMMAAAARGIVMCFHTTANLHVKRTAEREGVEVLTYTVIYKLLDDIKGRYDKQNSPYYAAARLWVDAIIDPVDTRKVISEGINAANNNPDIADLRTGVFQV